MIGQLHGKILLKNPPHLVLDVNGVGYEVEASMQTFYNLPEVNQMFTLITHLVVREDAHLLYGFANMLERDLFRVLLKVSGVGPKLALAILSTLEPNAFIQCIETQDVSSLVRVPGVGKKMAERLVIEMRDRTTAMQLEKFTHIEANQMRPSAQGDAISALVALGYKPELAQRAVKKVQPGESETSSEQLIKEALRELAGA